MPFHSGFVSIIGRPNAGKSTLLNALLGEKVAIVTHKAQTTRNRILGVLEVPARPKSKTREAQPAAQVVLVDTPGVHKPSSQLDKRMMQEVHDALESRDVILFLVDATHRLHDPEKLAREKTDANEKRALSAAEDAFALSLVRKAEAPVILVLNKIDLVPREDLLPLIAHWSAQHTFRQVVLISAKKHDGLEELTQRVVDLLPPGERYFPADQLTDQPERFLAAELIREKILTYTGEEVPYASAVVVERWEEPGPPRKPKKGEEAKLPVTKIAAAIFVERSGQKAILIGKGGAMLKQIGSAARHEIEALLGTRVFLELFVKVKEDWRSSKGFVEDLDWRRQIEAIGDLQQQPELKPVKSEDPA